VIGENTLVLTRATPQEWDHLPFTMTGLFKPRWTGTINPKRAISSSSSKEKLLSKHLFCISTSEFLTSTGIELTNHKALKQLFRKLFDLLEEHAHFKDARNMNIVQQVNTNPTTTTTTTKKESPKKNPKKEKEEESEEEEEPEEEIPKKKRRGNDSKKNSKRQKTEKR
jgi:hypothetical protein